ncbi:hypothetical protein B7C51_23055 [Paenibacillus larvae subsp. pulvifaciens]|uniref:Pre-toxin TG domain-containing protein n=1 Tax=Paenibacillus larvae subsp. pulvifaciens TaxID=1477 RepID=A0A1V0UY47_9BACL|nr:pre-toxin TG domain-containing protein [Paenibacillus larvae]ARF70107.1 hypothetical protein B7C51_23055 [Paenibacillus larvae subsp. pulvifaciens]
MRKITNVVVLFIFAVISFVTPYTQTVFAEETRLTLEKETAIYNAPSFSTKTISTISPQKVKVLEKRPDGWFKVATWLGDKWIAPKGAVVKPRKTEVFLRLYEGPDLDKTTKYSLSYVNYVLGLDGTADGFVKIKTEKGDMWIIEDTVPLQLTKSTPLYDYSWIGGQSIGVVSPQKVKVLEKDPYGLYRIVSWLGEKWIAPHGEKYKLTKPTVLYDHPADNTKSGFTLSPQTVTLLEFRSPWFYKINTWVGEKWISTIGTALSRDNDEYIKYDNFQTDSILESDMFVNLQSSKEVLQKYYDDLAQFQEKLNFIDWNEFRKHFENLPDFNFDFSEFDKSLEELAKWSASMDGYWEDFNASIQHMSSSVGEILSNIHIDTSKIEEAGDMIKRACDEINEGLKKMKSGLDVINGAVSNIHQNLTDMNTGMKQAQAGLNKANNGMSVANSAIDQAKKAHDTLQKYLKDPIKIKKETRGSDLPKLKSLGFDFDFSSYLTLENVSVAIDLIPIVGNIKAGGEVISGYDPITGVPLEGPDYVLGIIGIIVGGEFKQVGKIAGKATELEAKANKITKSMVTKVPSEIKLSTGNIKHLWNGHSFESFANQIPYLMKTKSRDAVEKQLSNISFFNKNLSKEEIVSSVGKAANEALSNGVTHGQYKTKINGEIITVAFDNGTFQTAWGTHNYTLSDFGY